MSDVKTALRVATNLICGLLIAYGLLLLGTALVGLCLGGPREPPWGMAWDEFKIWTESGRWFWEPLGEGIAWTILPALAIWVVNRTTKK